MYVSVKNHGPCVSLEISFVEDIRFLLSILKHRSQIFTSSREFLGSFWILKDLIVSGDLILGLFHK
jgi:hypothetical protein